MELAKIRLAAEMTAECRRVEFDSRAPKDTRYIAMLWCSAVGQDVAGYGPDVWTAVQAAHAARARYTASPHLFPF